MIQDKRIRTNFTQISSPTMRVLSDSQIQEIHFAALEVLSRYGMKIENDTARDLLHAHGAMVNGKIVRIPTKLVEKALSTVPSRIVICERDGDPLMFLEGYNGHYGYDDTQEYYDVYTGERRKTVTDDYYKMAGVIDSTKNIDFVITSGFQTDVPEIIADRCAIRDWMFNMRKVVGFSCNGPESIDDIAEMYSIIAGSEEALKHDPRCFHLTEPISPMVHEGPALGALMACARHEIPVVYYPMTMAGVTAPATIEGLLTQSHAESLTGMVIHQLTNPGAPFIYGAIPSVMDMGTTKWCYGAPELFLGAAAIADIGHYFKVPIWGTSGTVDSKTVDQQCATEMALGYLMSALSGQNLIHDTGLMDGASVSCPEIALLADEIIEMIKHIIRGYNLTEDHLALPEIKNSLVHGNFLQEEHTFRHFRKIWTPEIFDRTFGKTAESIDTKLNNKAKDLYENYKAPELDPYKKKAVLELEKKWREREGL